MEREVLKALIAQRTRSNGKYISETLSTSSNLGGIATPLVDREGFPRADIDIHTTRTLRNNLRRSTLTTKPSGRIESGLLNALPSSGSSTQQPTGGMRNKDRRHRQRHRPSNISLHTWQPQGRRRLRSGHRQVRARWRSSTAM